MPVAAPQKNRKKTLSGKQLRQTQPSLKLTPEQIARVDQLLAEPTLIIECPEFADRSRFAEIERDLSDDETESRIPAPAGTPPYLASLYSTALLSREQEYHLFRQMHFFKLRAKAFEAKLRRSSPAVADLEVWQYWRTQANRVRNAIVQANLRLVVSIAKTMVDASTSLDELISEGNVPLLRAVEIFDYTRGLRFSTYATWAIRHSLYRLTPRNRLQRKRFVTGLESAEFQSTVTKTGMGLPIETSSAQSIQRLLTRLDERERIIVERRFGLGKSPRAFKFREIAGELRISTERVRQLLQRALDRLRQLAQQMGLDWDAIAA